MYRQQSEYLAVLANGDSCIRVRIDQNVHFAEFFAFTHKSGVSARQNNRFRALDKRLKPTLRNALRAEVAAHLVLSRKKWLFERKLQQAKELFGPCILLGL
jgi:hypothetical protein